MDPLIILGFLKNNWKWIAIGIAVAVALGYVETLRLEVDHYKTKAGALELQIATAKRVQKEETERQNLAFDAQTRKYADSLRAKGDVIMKGYNDAVTRIKAHEASKHVVIASDVVELFNSTIVGPEVGRSETTATKPEDARKAAAIEKTLNDLLLVSAENNTNHQVCIETVLEWQKFWEDYKDARSSGHSN